MDRTVATHAGFALVGVVLALAAWLAPATGSVDNSVVMLPGSADELNEVVWKDPRYEIRIARATGAQEGKASDGNPNVTITVQRLAQQEPAPAQEGGETQASAPPPETAPAKSYPGTEQARQLFVDMAPLRATRSLGLLPADKLEGLGLADPESLTLRFAGAEKTVLVSSVAIGSTSRYARIASGEVFIIPSSQISALRGGATALIDRQVVGIQPQEVRKVLITAGPVRREVTHRHPEEPEQAFFADPAVPDEKLEKLSRWLDRIFKLDAIDLVETKPSGTPALSVEFANGKGSLGSFALWPAEGARALVTSSRFDRALEISKANAQAILKDVETVLQEGR